MLNNIGPFGLIVILIVVLLLFGRGKIPQLMGDVAKGIKSFKRGMKDEIEDGASADVKKAEGPDAAIDVTPPQAKAGDPEPGAGTKT
ncbi:MAG: twin-arginine translocase TatA/TatE family subunit [Pseudomonadota bacterium]